MLKADVYPNVIVKKMMTCVEMKKKASLNQSFELMLINLNTKIFCNYGAKKMAIISSSKL
jgi:hypothetical protein